jgi:hypothetical protein
VDTSDFDPLPPAEEMVPLHGWRAARAFLRDDGFLHVTRSPFRVTFIPRALQRLVSDDPEGFMEAWYTAREQEHEDRRSQIRPVEEGAAEMEETYPELRPYPDEQDPPGLRLAVEETEAGQMAGDDDEGFGPHPFA